MAITSYMVAQASDHLSDKHKELWLFWFRKLDKYKEYAFVYSDLLPARLDDAEGTIKARMLNALMKEIDALEVGEVSIEGDREGTHWSQSVERLTLIEEALDVLFDDISTLIVPYGSVVLNADGTYKSTGAAYGQRIVTVCCPVCSVPYYGDGSKCRCRI